MILEFDWKRIERNGKDLRIKDWLVLRWGKEQDVISMGGDMIDRDSRGMLQRDVAGGCWVDELRIKLKQELFGGERSEKM